MAQDFIGKPPSRGTVDDFVDSIAVRVSRPWSVFFSRVFEICFAVAQSGTTTQRPTVGLFIGRPYFDTTLGQPIWWEGTEWVDATGASA